MTRTLYPRLIADMYFLFLDSFSYSPSFHPNVFFFISSGIQRLPDAAIIRYPPPDDLWLGRPDSNNTHYSSIFDLPLMEKCGIFFTFL